MANKEDAHRIDNSTAVTDAEEWGAHDEEYVLRSGTTPEAIYALINIRAKDYGVDGHSITLTDGAAPVIRITSKQKSKKPAMECTWNLTKSDQGRLVQITVKVKDQTDFDQICAAVNAAIQAFRPLVKDPDLPDASLVSTESGDSASTVAPQSDLTKEGEVSVETDITQGWIQV